MFGFGCRHKIFRWAINKVDFGKMVFSFANGVGVYSGIFPQHSSEQIHGSNSHLKGASPWYNPDDTNPLGALLDEMYHYDQ